MEWRTGYGLGKAPRKRIHCGKDREFVIIGIAPEVPFLGLAQAVGNQVYVSIEQDPPSGLSVLLRTQGEPLAYVESVRRAVISIDPGRAISNITSVQALADQTIAGAHVYYCHCHSRSPGSQQYVIGRRVT